MENFNLFNQFTIDIRNLKADDFLTHEEEAPGKIRHSIYTGDVMELNLFDDLEMLDFGTGERSLFFSAYITNEIDIGRFVKFIDDLTDAVGTDLTGSGKFQDSDLNALQKMQWLGRMWYNTSPSVSISQQALKIELAVTNVFPDQQNIKVK